MQTILTNIAIILFKRYVLPELRNNAYSKIHMMGDKIIQSKRNPVDVDSVNDITEHATKVFEDIFEEF